MYSENNKISEWCKKLQAQTSRQPIFKIFWREHFTPLCRRGKRYMYSSPASHRAPVIATRQCSSYLKISSCYFFSIWTPCTLWIIKYMYYAQNNLLQKCTHLVAKSIFSRNSNKQFKPSNSINLCTNLQEKALITIHSP